MDQFAFGAKFAVRGVSHSETPLVSEANGVGSVGLEPTTEGL
jgi:hypothetical protein